MAKPSTLAKTKAPEDRFLKVGDVIVADESWEITNYDLDKIKTDKSLSLNQCFKRYSEKDGHRLETPVPIAAAKKVSLIFNIKGSHTFVVTRTAMTGGGNGHGYNDYYPDGHQVSIKQLNKDGSYDPKGRECHFYQSGSFNCMIENVTPIRKMTPTFV